VSVKNVETVRCIYESMDLSEPGSVSRTSVRRAFGLIDPEIEWRGPSEFPGLAEPHYGHQGIAEYAAKIAEAFDQYRMLPERFVDVGEDRVLVFSREAGRGKGSGAEVQTHMTAHVWTLRDGKAVRFQSYWERKDALEAVGLEN
jgi:ketosteroid isomerase-like protein